jgi:uncharacterized protein YgiM (DUF1202 family)
MKNLLFIALTSLLLISCNANERNAKKFFKRLNSKEIGAASKYIWPDDHKKLHVFNTLFLEDNKLINFELEDAEAEEINGKEYVNLKIKCLNFSEPLNNYFDSLGIKKGEYIYDRVLVKTANDYDYLSFNWYWDTTKIASNLKLAEISADQLNLRSGPGINFDVVEVLKMNENVLIDANYNNKEWNKGVVFDQNKNPKTVFFSSKFSQQKEISFFTLGYFGQITGLFILIIALICFVIMYPILFIGIFRSGNGSGKIALILFAILIGSLYFTYQLLENTLFELFLINLPG